MGEVPNTVPPLNDKRSEHTLHIPVMGTGFTIDTPLKVARYGIESVISLVDDELIEQMRAYHSARSGMEYTPITRHDEDYRARRITAFLDLIGTLVERQIEQMTSQPFTPGSDLTRYFSLLPDCRLRDKYQLMLAEGDPVARAQFEAELRSEVVAGKINVNIMTKLDHLTFRHGKELPIEFSDSLAAMRGFARSRLNSAVVLSAGLNQRLFTYMGELDGFFPEGDAAPSKQVIIKVSDFRSALIQGKLLAKRGIWVSEFRVESGINCGGHAFIDKGYLLGPVLQEFHDNLQEMEAELRRLHSAALAKRGIETAWRTGRLRVSTQGGIGTNEEAQMLREQYGIDSIGCGTPFLLVPEVTNVESGDLGKLCSAKAEGVYLSDASPLGVPFWNLRNSESELARVRRIADGAPGSFCYKGYAAGNTEFGTPPLCVASRAYQRTKLAQIDQAELSPAEREAAVERVVVKSCICHDLAGNATRQYHIDEQATPAICCGPGIVDFAGPLSLDHIIDHIYGRASLLVDMRRPHMFIREIKLYLDYIKMRVAAGKEQMPAETLNSIVENLSNGVSYYRTLAENLLCKKRKQFRNDLAKLERAIAQLRAVTAPAML